MALFDGGRFSSQFDPSLGSDGDSDLITNKKRNISEAAQQKQETLAFNSELFDPNRLTDADTYDGRRFGGVPRESLDAAETSDYRFQNNPAAFTRQQKALADILGKRPEEVSQEDIITHGKRTQQKAKDFLMEGFNQGAPVRANPDGSPFEGPSRPRIEIADTGGAATSNIEGKKDRSLVQVRNPYTGKNLIDALNNPEDNLDYFSKYNVGRIEKDEQIAKDLKLAKKAKDDAQLKENPNRVFSQEELDNDKLKYAANLGLLATDTVAGFAGDVAKFLASDQLRSDVSKDDLFAFQSRKAKEESMLNIRNAIAATDDPAEKSKLIASLDAVKLTPKESALTDDVRELSFGRTLKNDKTGRSYPSKYEAIEKAVAGAETRTTISEFAKKYKLGNSSDIQEAAETVGKRFDTVKESFTQAQAAYENGDEAGAAVLIGDILKETGLAFSDVITQNPEAVLPLIAESLPYMLAAATKGGFAVITNTFYQQGIEEFQKENGGLVPTQEESLKVFATSLAAAGTELIGAKLTGITKALKGKKAKVKTDTPKPVTATYTRPVVNAALTAADKVGTSAVSRVGKLAKGTAGEAVTEATQTGLEELGVKQDLSKIDPKEVFVGGVLGGIAGGGVTGGVEAGSAAIDVTKAVTKPAVNVAKKAADTVSTKVTDAQSSVSSARTQASDTTLPTYDRATHAKAIANDNRNKDSAGQQTDLEELFAIKVSLIREAGTKGRDITPQENDKINSDIKLVNRITRSVEAKLSRNNASATKAAVISLSDKTKDTFEDTDVNTVTEQVLRTPVVRGSEDLEQYNSILENENAPESLKDIIRGSQDVHQATVDLAEKSGKTLAQVEAEKLGAGTNAEGKKGLLAHVAAVNSAVKAKNFKATAKAIGSLSSFVGGQQRKVAAITQALQEVKDDTRKFGSEVTYKKSSKGKKTTFTLKPGAVNLLKNTLVPELRLLEAELELAKRISTATFKLDEKGKEATPVFDKSSETEGVTDTDTKTSTDTSTESIQESNENIEEEIIAAPPPEESVEQFPEQEISIADLEGVPGNELRKSPKEFAEFTKKIQSGEIKPVIIVEMQNGKPVNIQEGNHSLEVLKALGKDKVTIRVINRKDTKPTTEPAKVFSNKTGIERVDANGSIQEMTPDEYIEAVAKEWGKFDPEFGTAAAIRKDMEKPRNKALIKKYAESMKQGDIFPTPFLDYRGQDDNVFVQEGIHRILAAESIGHTKIPVRIVEAESNAKQKTKEEVQPETQETATPVFVPSLEAVGNTFSVEVSPEELAEYEASVETDEQSAIDAITTQTENPAESIMDQREIEETLETGTEEEVQKVEEKSSTDTLTLINKELKVFNDNAAATKLLKRATKLLDRVINNKIVGIAKDVAIQKLSISHEKFMKPFLTYEFKEGELDGVAADSNLFRALNELANIPYRTTEARAAREAMISGLLKQSETLNAASMDQSILVNTYNFYEAHGLPTAQQTVIDPAISSNDVGVKGENKPLIRGGKKDEKATFTDFASNVLTSTQSTSAFSIPNLFASLQLPVIAKKIAKSFGLATQEDFAALNALIGDVSSISAYIDTLLGPFGQVSQITESPINLLRDAQGNLPVNMPAAMSVVALEWLATRGKETLNLDETQIGNFLGKPTDEVTDADKAKFWNKGLYSAFIEQDLGAAILKQMGIKVRDDAHGYLQGRLEISVGNYALAALENAGLVEFHVLTPEQLNGHFKNESNSPVDVGYTTFVKLPATLDENNQYEVPKNNNFDPSNKLAKDEFVNVIRKLFNLGRGVREPSLTPITKVKNSIRGVIVKISKSIKAGTLFQGNVPYTASPGMIKIIRGMDKVTFLKLNGYQEDISKISESILENVKDTNRQLIKAYDDMMEFVDKHPEGQKFYFKYFTALNMRTHTDSNTISLQNSKIHRFVFGAKSWEETFNPSDGNKTAPVMVAITEAFGMGTDKNVAEKITEYYSKEIMTDLATGTVHENYTAAVDLINSGKEQFNTKENAIIAEAVGKHGTHGLAGLYALASLSKAIKEGTDVTISLPREVDGITDGVISAFMQLPSSDIKHVKDILRAGGVFFAEDTFKKANQFAEAPENYDNYQQLTIAVNQQLQQMKGEVPPRVLESLKALFSVLIEPITIQDVITGVSKEVQKVTADGREFSKDPLMIGTYGAAVNTIVDKKIEDSLQNILNKLAEAENTTEAAKILEHIEVLLSDGKYEKTAASQAKMKIWVEKNLTDFTKNPLNQEQMQTIASIIEGTYGAALKQGILTQLGEFITSRSYINGAVDIMNRIFVSLYNERVAEATAANDGVPISIAARDKIVHDLKDEGLLPGLKHASSESFDDSLQITNKSNVTVKDTEAKYRNTYAKGTGVKLNTYASTAAGNVIRNPEAASINSKGGSIRMPTYDLDIGVKALAILNQSMDGNTASPMMAEGDTHNLFDAIVGNLFTLNSSGQRMSEVWFNNQKEYSMVTAVDEALNRFMAAYTSKLSSKDQSTINSHIATKEGRISIKLPFLNTYGNPASRYIESINAFNTQWATFKKNMLRNREAIFGENGVTIVDHYAADAFNIKDQSPTGKTREEQKADVDKLSEAVIEEELNQETIVQAKVKGNKKVEHVVRGKTVEGWPIMLEGLSENFMVYESTDPGKYWHVVHKETGRSINVPGQKRRIDALDSFTTYIMETHGSLSAFNAHIDKKLKEARGSTTNTSFDGFNPDTFYNTADVAAELIFDNLENVGNVTESRAHSNHLRNVILSIIKPGLASLDPVMIEVGHIPNSDSNKGQIEEENIYVAAAEGIIKAGTDMSTQEVLTHEYVHAIMEKAINGDANIQKELRRIFLAAEKVVTVEDFLRRDNQGNVVIPSGSTLALEMEQAKARRDYIFRNRTAYLHEFAAFGLTNESFIAALARTENKPYKDIYTGSLYKRLKAILANAIAWLSNALQKKGKAGNLHAALTQLAIDANGINKGNQRKVTAYVSALNKINSAAKVALMDYIVQPYARSVEAIQKESIAKKTKPLKILNGTYGLPYHITTESFRNNVNDFMIKQGYSRDNMLHKLLVEIGGASAITKPYHKLLRYAKHHRDAAKERMAVLTEQEIVHYFDKARGYTDQDYEDLSTAVLKTELFNIIGIYGIPKIIDFFKSDRAIDTAVASIKKELHKNHSVDANYYINQANSLGHLMATGRAGLAEQQLNAHNIALMRSFEGRRAPQGDVEAAKKLIDTLATLESIRFTATRARKLTAATIDHEYGRNTDINGISYMMSIQADFKERSKKELFNSDETSMVKGFTHEMYDEFKTMKVGTAADRVEFEKEGYILYGDGAPLSQDQFSGLKNAEMYMYISKDGLLNKKVTGIVSLTSKQSKGQDLVGFFRDNDTTSGAHSLAAAEMKKQKKRNKRALEEQFKQELPLNVKNNWLVPILDSTGETVNYRYMMKEDTKIKALGKKDMAHKVLGRMTASIIDKTETTKYNRQLLELAKDDFDKNYLNDTNLYVEIGPKVTNPKYREIYRLLPKDMQMDIKNIWGEDTMLIREDMIGITFGFRKLSFTNWLNAVTAKVGTKLDPSSKVITRNASLVPKVMQHSMRMSGMIWQAAISRAKRNIVFLIPTVLINNVTSNSLISLARGMPVNYMMREQKNGITALNDYTAQKTKRDRLETLLRVTPNLANRAARERELERLNTDLSNNPVSSLIDEGIFQIIVEDISTQEDKLLKSVRNASAIVDRTSNIAEGVTPSYVKTGYKQAIVAPDTEIGQDLLTTTQMSDFVARYALYQFLTTKKGVEHEAALEDVIDTFVNYDVPTSAEMQWLNDMGIYMFTKFLFRIQRVIFKQFKETPASALALETAQVLTGDLPTIADSNLLSSHWMVPGSPSPLGEVFISPYYELLG